MENVKEIIARNLAELRRENKMTQSALAERLNYSDKAISRWEHAETLPDIETLLRVCEIYGVEFQYLLEKEHTEKEGTEKGSSTRSREILISLIAMSTVWLLAILAFTSAKAAANIYIWQVYIWALPVTCAVLLISNIIWWHSRLCTMISASFINWTLVLSIYLQLLKYNLWTLFLAAIPIQAIIILSEFKKK